MKKVYLAAVAGNLGMLSVGQFYSWTSPSLPVLIHGNYTEYPVHLTMEEASWVAALLTLGAAIGSVACAVMVNTIGTCFSTYHVFLSKY